MADLNASTRNVLHCRYILEKIQDFYNTSCNLLVIGQNQCTGTREGRTRNMAVRNNFDSESRK